MGLDGQIDLRELAGRLGRQGIIVSAPGLRSPRYWGSAGSIL